jgi:urease accessory protein
VTTAAPTRTTTKAKPGARLTVARRGERTELAELSSSVPVGLYALRSSTVDMAHVALTQTAAMLVAGDDVSLQVSVGAGAGLLLRELSATIAHPGTVPARQRISIDVAPGGVLIMLEEPLVIAAGARVQRVLEIELAQTAVVLHRDTMVLGRHAELPGDATISQHVTRGGTPVLEETLMTADRAATASPAVLGGARAVGTLALYGGRPPGDLPPWALELAAGDVVARRIGAHLREISELDVLTGLWVSAIAVRHQSRD